MTCEYSHVTEPDELLSDQVPFAGFFCHVPPNVCSWKPDQAMTLWMQVPASSVPPESDSE